MKATRNHVTPVTKMPDGKYAAIVAATVIARPSLTPDQVRDYVRTERSIHRTRVTHFIAVAPVVEIVEWILQGIEG